MRILFCFLIFLPAFSWAQVAIVRKDRAIVDVPTSQTYAPNDAVHFLNSGGVKVAEGQILKVSPDHKKALIQITSGRVAPGMNISRRSIASLGGATRMPAQTLTPLTPEEKEILARGPIDEHDYILGGFLGIFPGFGLGHAIQNRYLDDGWIFTVGEAVTSVIGFGSLLQTTSGSQNTTAQLAAAAYLGFRIWEIIDVWKAPPEINDRYKKLKWRASQSWNLQPSLMPLAGGAGLGIELRF